MGVWPPVVQTDRDRVGGRKLKQAVEYLEYLGGEERVSHVFPAAPQWARSGFNQGYQSSISCTIKLTAEMKRRKENGWKRQPTVRNRKSKQAPSFQRVTASLLLFILEMKSSCKKVLS